MTKKPIGSGLDPFAPFKLIALMVPVIVGLLGRKWFWGLLGASSVVTFFLIIHDSV